MRFLPFAFGDGIRRKRNWATASTLRVSEEIRGLPHSRPGLLNLWAVGLPVFNLSFFQALFNERARVITFDHFTSLVGGSLSRCSLILGV